MLFKHLTFLVSEEAFLGDEHQCPLWYKDYLVSEIDVAVGGKRFLLTQMVGFDQMKGPQVMNAFYHLTKASISNQSLSKRV